MKSFGTFLTEARRNPKVNKREAPYYALEQYNKPGYYATYITDPKRFETNTIKIAIGLFFSVIIYYINNFFFVLGSTERLPLFASVLIPLLILTLTNSFMIKNINEK